MQPEEQTDNQVGVTQPAATDQGAASPAEQPDTPTAEVEQWQANEYIHHEKTALWFIVFSIVVVTLIVLAWLVFQSISFVIVVVVMAVAVVVLLRRPPNIAKYALSAKGLYINDTLHNFSEFRSFAIVDDHGEHSIVMIPVRRFQPGITVYFPAEKGEAIVDMLGVRLPVEERSLDLVDRLVHILRF